MVAFLAIIGLIMGTCIALYILGFLVEWILFCFGIKIPHENRLIACVKLTWVIILISSILIFITAAIVAAAQGKLRKKH